MMSNYPGNPICFFVFLLLCIGSYFYTRYLSKQRLYKLRAWAQSKGLTFNSDNDVDFKIKFPHFDCLTLGVNQYASNLLSGKWKNRQFWGFDYYYQPSPKGGLNFFSAVILLSEIPLEPLFVRPEGFFEKVTELIGFEEIKFESAEFNRKFFVKSANKQWAYHVIHQRTMEFLLANPNFTIQFAPTCVIAYHNDLFSLRGFEHAAEIISGILDRLPGYLKKHQNENTPLPEMEINGGRNDLSSGG
jgi:hypothetical protein